jgi:C1A family cysteine protease
MQKIVASALVGTAVAGCSGSDDPVVTQPMCYHGSAGALGLTENVDVTIKDFASKAGHIDVKGDGIEAFTCSNKPFTKSGQGIVTDLSDCAPSAITIPTINYCSDSDEIQVVVKDKAVPLPIKATLKKVNCGSTQKSAMQNMWDEFAAQHAQNGDEESRTIFEANVQYIIEENKKGHDYYLGVNKFAAMTREEFKQMLGFKKPSTEAPTLGVHKYSGAALPDSVDWTTKGAVTDIKNQGQCGSCWAFSTTGSLEGRNAIAKGKLVAMSEQQLVDCDTESGDQGCNGGLMDNAFTYVEKYGLCTEDSYKYTGKAGDCKAEKCTAALQPGEVTGFVDVDASEDALAEAVAAGPVSVAVEADTIFQFYSGGVMGGPCGANLDHGVLVVGYGEDSGTKYWKVKNSWGASWGEQGYLRMKKGKGGKGECGILTGPPSYPQIGSSVSV